MKKGDVFRHYEGLFYKITDVRKIGNETRVYLETKSGSRINMTKRQFENPVIVEGGNIARFNFAGNDPQNPWRK